jgi:DNA-directed RNA polymerase specialized sigma24 family protein
VIGTERRASATGVPVRDDPSVVALVTRAAGSDEGAWHELVDRYAPLVWSICVRYQLSGADIEDVGQTVWLGLVEQLTNERLREPAALPGWLATTTQRECLRVLRAPG